MTRDKDPHPTMHQQPMGVNGLPDDYIDDSDREDAVGGSRDDHEPQPISGPPIAPDTGDERVDTVIKPTHPG